MSNFKLKATHAPVKAYYETLERFGRGKFDNEGNIRRAFEALLEKCARTYEWFLVAEYPIPRSGRNPLKVDAAVLDAFNLPRGYWEAKDEKDDLKAEMNKKFAEGYPRTNILFQKPTHAILFQDGRIAFDVPITDPEKLVDVLRLFFEWRQPHQEDWDRAVREFSERIPEIAKGVMTLIEGERKSNPAFVARFTAFAELCRESINPELEDEAVEEMLVQHLLTERIFRRIFNNPDFTRRNVIAAEIEKVIDSLVRRQFRRDDFLRELDPFYKAIEETAATASDYSEKQAFLNSVYERFFQGFSKKQADTHGIVYTPQPIVDFMVRSVEQVLKAEFGRSLSDRGVEIIDPFVGTGNFITRVMKEMRTGSLPHKYREELHCNEVMLLPYYIASMNIEHAYLERVDGYEPFEGICLVDTFELTKAKVGANYELFTAANTSRVRRQQAAPIKVIIGNPPYNVGQRNEEDDNKKRKYPKLDKRVAETYAADSSAQSVSKLDDPYVKAFRWASDRIGSEGIVTFVSNNSYIEKMIFDGVRKNLLEDFDTLYVINLQGDIRRDSMRDGIPLGEKHTVFGMSAMVGVAIAVFIRNSASRKGLHYLELPFRSTRAEKFEWLKGQRSFFEIAWEQLTPDQNHTWLTKELVPGFEGLINLSARAGHGIFGTHSLGVSTNRDPWAYNFDPDELAKNVGCSLDYYNGQVDRWNGSGRKGALADFHPSEPKKISWSRDLKLDLKRGKKSEFSKERIRESIYRPYTNSNVYLDRVFNEEVYQFPRYFPKAASESENLTVGVGGYGRKPFSVLVSRKIVNLNLFADPAQQFPFYTYDEDGTHRRENITDWALGEFRKHYGHSARKHPSGAKARAVLGESGGTAEAVPFQSQGRSLDSKKSLAGSEVVSFEKPLEEGDWDEISKLDIFHYVYGLLHHPEYRTRYAANLKRELPRIPMAPDFARYAEIGAALMKLHIEYEQQAEYPLKRTETGKLDWRVEKMTLSKDKTQLRYNEFLTLSGIPPEVYEYRLGNRSALEWVVDQYRVSTDARSGIVNDPNREDDPEYIVRLIGQVVTVSVETVRLVKELAALSIDQV